MEWTRNSGLRFHIFRVTTCSVFMSNSHFFFTRIKRPILDQNLDSPSEQKVVCMIVLRDRVLVDGRGPIVRVTFALRCLAGETVTTRHDFPLPDPPASVEAAGGFNYPNSNGFQYEADAIHKCIRAGRTSSDQYTTNEMMAVS